MKTCIEFFVLVVVTLGRAENSNCPVHELRTYKLYQFGRSCYEFNMRLSLKSWRDAAEDCINKCGRLVDIHSQAEQDFITSTWMVVAEKENSHVEKLWLSIKFDSEGKWSWFLGKKETDFHHWAPSRPGNASNGKDEDCGLMEITGKWYDYPCDDFNGWICEFRAVPNFDCPKSLPKTYNLLQWRDHCYLFIIKDFNDWHSADFSCREKGGNLVDIHSQDEQDFIYRAWAERFQAPEVKGLWTGLTDSHQEGQWNWTSNMKQLDYQNWYPGQPDIEGDREEDCALMTWTDNGQWHDYPCNKSILHGWICKFQRDN